MRSPLPSFAGLSHPAATGMELPASGRRALEREEAKVRQGKQMRWAQIKKCQKQGRTVVFLEESGLRRSWAS